MRCSQLQAIKQEKTKLESEVQKRDQTAKVQHDQLEK